MGAASCTHRAVGQGKPAGGWAVVVWYSQGQAPILHCARCVRPAAAGPAPTCLGLPLAPAAGYCRIDGNTSGEDRESQIDDYNRVGGERLLELRSSRLCREGSCAHCMPLGRQTGWFSARRPNLSLRPAIMMTAGGQREVCLPAVHARRRPGHQPVHRRHCHPVRLGCAPLTNTLSIPALPLPLRPN